MKNNLYLDMVLDSCNFVLFDDEKNIIDQFNLKTHNNLIDKVVKLLKEFLTKNNLNYNELNNLYINVGPGSFTGTKAIVNIAKSIKYVFNHIKLFIITNDLVFSCGNGISIIDAKSNKFYMSVYEDKQELVKLSIYTNEQKQEIINKYHYLNIFDENNTNAIDRCENIIQHLDLFSECDDFLSLEPTYIKSALNN